MKLRLTRRAIENLADIADYLRERNPIAAQRAGVAIRSSIESLARFPYSGRRRTAEPIRKLVVPRYPYLVYYQVDKPAGEIVILNMKHAAQRREHADR